MKKVSEKAKKILSFVFAAILVAAAVFGAVYYSNAKKDYASNSKNAISMGTVITSKIYGENTASINETVISIIQQLDDVISWREDSSAISSLNKNKVLKSSELAAVVELCNKVSKSSDGAFDITIGNVSNLWGFGTDDERVPTESEIKSALKSVNYETLTVSDGVITCNNGQFIDLGAVGKGYACDMIYEYLSQTDTEGAVVSVGGSIVAYGNRNKLGDKWRIAIKHPRDEQSFIGTVCIDEGFVSTSGDYERYFIKDGKRYHHLLDARTGYPAENGLTSVTIVSDSGILSDALSTACFVLGVEKGTALAEEYGVSAIFVDENENITVVGDVEFEKAQTND